jgi:hypothetical protein
MTHEVPENVQAAGRTKGHDRAAYELQLYESPAGALDDVTLSKAHTFSSLQNACAANDSQRAFQEGNRADALHSRWKGQQQQGQRYAERIHVDPKIRELQYIVVGHIQPKEEVYSS